MAPGGFTGLSLCVKIREKMLQYIPGYKDTTKYRSNTQHHTRYCV